MFIKLSDGNIVQALAVDCGEKIVGKHIDWYCDNLDEAYLFGVQQLLVGVIK